MAGSVPKAVHGKQVRKTTARRKKSRSLLTNVALGVGMTVGALVCASMATMATAVKPASEVKINVAMPKPAATMASLGEVALAAGHLSRGPIDIDVNKFSRLPGSSPAEPKAGRLEGAAAAALAARRPEPADVQVALQAALASAARNRAMDQQFAALEKSRPGADQVRSILGSAMASLVVVAPRGDSSLPDLIQDAAPATSVAELKDMKPVEMAALEDTSLEEETEETVVASLPEPAPVETHSLPKSGPLPVIRPSTSLAQAEKPAKPNALAAIAAVAPQKPRGNDDDKPTALAFAKPDNPMRQEPSRPAPSAPNWPGIGSKVAIYDITNGVVHMPNGTKLEAHSGIGSMRDNPKYTHVKMRGPTPPGTYKLSMREKLFHGVAAIRLTSVDGKHPQNRTGLLAHSYLLRVKGDSHGCVAFAQYDKFLKAFQRGEITHMVIVPKWDGKRPGGGSNGNFLAKLFSGSDA